MRLTKAAVAGAAGLLGLLVATVAHAAEPGSAIDNAIAAFSGAVFAQVRLFGADVEVIVLWMAAPMLFLTVYFGFINLRGFRIAWRIIRGHYHDDTAPGQVTQFQALSTALSGTVGLGNIAGVAIAIALGGPGATFWMIIIGLFAMSLKFAECTLGVKYRIEHADGSVSGGPMYYLRRGLTARGLPRLGAFLAISYAIIGLPSMLQIVQVNQAYSQFGAVTGLDSVAASWIFGIVLAALVGAVIIGGIRSIARVTARLVPLMCAVYITAALVIIIGNIGEVPRAVATIINGAFNPEGVVGGIIGVIVIGMRRAVYSTEAGLGSATMAHAAAKTREPVSEGMVALMEPFIDTVVVSTMTALVIVITGAYRLEGLGDIQITSAAFASVISWFPYILALAVLLFAFSTIISWGYYASKVWTFLFGRSPLSVNGFKVLYCVMLVPGAVLTTAQVVDVMDSLFFLLAVPNIIGIYIMAPELKRDLKSYLARLRAGDIPTAARLAASAAE